MPQDAFALSGDFARKVVEVVRRVLAEPKNAPWTRPVGSRAQVPNWQIVRCTGTPTAGSSQSGSGSCSGEASEGSGSGTGASGSDRNYYPGAVTVYSTRTHEWEDVGTCWLMDMNHDKAFKIGRRYPAVQSGNLCLGGESRPLFVAESLTSTGRLPVRVSCTGTTLDVTYEDA